MATTAAKHPTRKPRGSYALDIDDPRGFPMAQGEMLYQLVAWMVNQMEPVAREAFIQGLVVKAAENAERMGFGPAGPAEQPKPPAARRKRRA